MRAWALESGVRWGEDVSRRERYQLGSLAAGHVGDRAGPAPARGGDGRGGPALRRHRPARRRRRLERRRPGRAAGGVRRPAHGDPRTSSPGRAPPTEWFDALDRAVRLLTDVAPADRWQQAEAARAIDAVRTATSTTLRLADVVALLEPHLAGRPTRANFRTGALTVCSLAPMRAVPHRVVALLGMDDGAFPRGSGRDGDDVLARDPLVGERDARQEDRQLFLDAVTSAQQHLVVVYSGADERTGATRPPAVPVGELLDALDGAVTYPEGRTARTRWSTTRSRPSTSATSWRAGSAGPNRSASTCSTSPRRSPRRRADAPDHADAAGPSGERPPRPRGPGVHPRAPRPRVHPDPARRDPARRRAAARRPAPPGAGRPRPLGRRRPAAAGRAGRHLPRRRRRGRAAPRSHAAGHARRRHAPADPWRRSSRCSRHRRGTWSSPRRASTSRSRCRTDGCSRARSTACTATSWSARCSPGSAPSTACARGCSCSRCRRRSRTARSRR